MLGEKSQELRNVAPVGVERLRRIVPLGAEMASQASISAATFGAIRFVSVFGAIHARPRAGGTQFFAAI